MLFFISPYNYIIVYIELDIFRVNKFNMRACGLHSHRTHNTRNWKENLHAANNNTILFELDNILLFLNTLAYFTSALHNGL